MTGSGVPADQPARDSIREDLDVCLVVEAAAGSGKTTCLVDRLFQLLRRGELSGDRRLAAVTFTRKAAGELRERLETRLSGALAGAGSLTPEEIRNLEAARHRLAECHVGTIHSFCARLLREHPVESGVGPGFRELEADDDKSLRDQAWDELTRRPRRGGNPGLAASFEVFEAFGLDMELLRPGFHAFSNYPDVENWIGRDAPAAGPAADLFLAGLDKYLETWANLPELLAKADPGNDKLIPLLRKLFSRWRRWRRRSGPDAALSLLEALQENPAQILKAWTAAGFAKEPARAVRDAYADFHARVAQPFRRTCLAQAYAEVMRAFFQAREIHDRLRREAGGLNFQDLLLKTAALLREHPGVRVRLAERYARILIDEVQDTDPAQAEIMFLLAADDPRERDWRACRPRPGALFFVGDPKQSIYRFRRADMAVYQEAKNLVRDRGGRILHLSANFRSQPAVIDWINRRFGSVSAADAGGGDGGEDGTDAPPAASFSAGDTKYGPAYAPLRPALPPAPANAFSGVFRLETLPQRQRSFHLDDILADEAGRIARFIRRAVDSGLPLPTREGRTRPAEPGDFLVITPRKSRINYHIRALRGLGLDCLASGGASLGDSGALRLLLEYLRALAFPEDPIPTLAVLRGGLFGISDPELYAWKKLGGAFSFAARFPEGADGTRAGAALAILARHRDAFQAEPPLAALELALEELGFWPYACLEDDSASRAGELAAALELLRGEGGRINSLEKLLERLVWRIDNHEEDLFADGPARRGAVRVMNIHKAKGLEAPVVFLTCTRQVRSHDPEFAVVRDGTRVVGAIRVAGGSHRARRLAQPAAWEELAAEEARFLAAEKTRLNYVAATRAGAALVISLHQAEKIWKSGFIPGGSADLGDLEKLPEPEAAEAEFPGKPVFEPPGADLEAMSARREKRRAARLVAVKLAAAGIGDGPAERPEEAADAGLLRYGEALHRLLTPEWDAAAGDAVTLAAAAAGLLEEFGLPADLAPELAGLAISARGSGLWRRASASGQMFRETPYVLPDSGPEAGGGRHGVIDLVFREAGGWVIVDYKSGHPANPAAEAEKHAPQLAAYARAWRRLTGEEVAETGIYFLHGGGYAMVAAAKP